ncbi:hypothetical protein ACFLV4_03825 [Chloroflexota bacterium]
MKCIICKREFNTLDDPDRWTCYSGDCHKVFLAIPEQVRILLRILTEKSQLAPQDAIKLLKLEED